MQASMASLVFFYFFLRRSGSGRKKEALESHRKHSRLDTRAPVAPSTHSPSICQQALAARFCRLEVLLFRRCGLAQRDEAGFDGAVGPPVLAAGQRRHRGAQRMRSGDNRDRVHDTLVFWREAVEEGGSLRCVEREKVGALFSVLIPCRRLSVHIAFRPRHSFKKKNFG